MTDHKKNLVERLKSASSSAGGGSAVWDDDEACLEAAAEIVRLRKSLEKIKRLKPEPIGETGFSTGPQALLNAAQRIAKDALKDSK